MSHDNVTIAIGYETLKVTLAPADIILLLKTSHLTILTNGLYLSRKLARAIAVCSKPAIKTTGEQLFKALDEDMLGKPSCLKCVGLCTDAAAAIDL